LVQKESKSIAKSPEELEKDEFEKRKELQKQVIKYIDRIKSEAVKYLNETPVLDDLQLSIDVSLYQGTYHDGKLLLEIKDSKTLWS